MIDKKLTLNNDALYYKCGIIIALPILLASLVCCKTLLSAYITYILVGIPVIVLMKVLFAKFLMGEEHYLLLQNDTVTIYHGYRFDEPEMSRHSLESAQIVYRHIPCLEAIVFNDTHPEVIYKYMLSSKDYRLLLQRMRQNNHANNT